MAHHLIIGGGGMLGSGLVRSLADKNNQSSVKITLFDLVEPQWASKSEQNDNNVEIITCKGDIADPATAHALIADRPDIIYHLAAIVSGEAERDFAKGYRINVDGTRYLFEAIREANEQDGYFPRVVFTSSLAVFGAPLPDVIDDNQILTPRSSYGTQKAIGELLLADYSRKGFFDGIGIRLPTICVRPGKPNAAASGFFSGIIREPLAGLPAILPVSDEVTHWFASPKAAIGYIEHAGKLASSLLPEQRNFTMPGVSASIADEIAVLREIAGDEAVKLIKREPDAAIETIISSWPKAFNTKIALDLGFIPDSSMREIIEIYVKEHEPQWLSDQ